MPLTPGTTLGSYTVTAKIGEGGMGEVYRARDTKLDRDVALKVLPQAFTDDPDRLARFEREAKVLASLNHPNIGHIYGLEEAEGTRALVLELIEGPTLADRIAQGAIPVDEALPIAKQIAEALEAAHEAGVIHRDLKPANIKVKGDGTVKVLDFGLAKALDTTPEGDPSQSPTLTAAATQMGVIMGTAAYMSPEQASGETADKRSDIWSFGVVLFEMLTGQRLFTGKTVAHVMAKVLDRDLDLTVLPTTTPAPIKRLLRRCLEREQRRRLRDVGEALSDLEEAATAPAEDLSVTAPIVQPAGWRQALPWVAGIAIGGVIVGIAAWTLMRPAVALPTRFTVVPPPGVQATGLFGLSPDGQTLAFGGSTGSGSQVYLRQLDQFEAVPLRGAAGTVPLDFSSDGRELLVMDAGRDGTAEPTAPLKRVPVTGAPGMMVAAGQGGGAAWGPDGTVILGGGNGLQLLRASGEDATSLTTLAEGEINHFVPEFLPSGRAVLFTTWNGAEGQVAVHDVETAIRTNLFTGTTPRYATSGHLIFWRDSSLWAVPFDADRLEVLGDPQVVVEGVASYTQADVGAYSVSTDGTLAYLPGSDGRTLVWVDRQGQPTPFVDETADYLYPRLSPDETTAAVQIEGNIWICESGRACRPFTTNGGLFPVWTPDGTHIAFQSSRDGDPDLYWKEVDGSGEAERLLAREGLQFPMSWSSDGQVLAFSDGSGGPDDIFLLPLDGEPEEYLATASREATPTFSRDGRWIAYRSDDAGQFRLYVRPYPGPGGEELVSLEAGAEPAWGGRELFFRDGARMMAVEVEDGETFGIPRLLFDGYENIDGRNYDVTSDGERFLMVMRQASAEEIHVVQNWFEELKERVPIP